MIKFPLNDLIYNRGFDDFQDGLKSRFGAYGIDYKLVYGKDTSKPAMELKFESAIQIGNITVWTTGECDMLVLDKLSGASVFNEILQFNSEREFQEGYPKLVIFMRDSLDE